MSSLKYLDNNAGVIRETDETLRKRGDVYRLSREVEAMEYVRARTSIPIPRVLETSFNGGDSGSNNSRYPDEIGWEGWFIMERLPGEQLGEAWPNMSEGARARTLRQLRSYFQQLHGIRPNGVGWIGSCSGGPAYDHRIDNMATCGPFTSVAAFNDFLVSPVKKCPRPELEAKYRKQLPDSYNIVFTHADVSWENILVDRLSGNVTGIIDWEMAGFWPEWWEYRKALSGSRNMPWWRIIVTEFMEEYMSVTDVDMDVEMF